MPGGIFSVIWIHPNCHGSSMGSIGHLHPGMLWKSEFYHEKVGVADVKLSIVCP